MDEARPGVTRWEDLDPKVQKHYQHGAPNACTCEPGDIDIDCTSHGYSLSNNYGGTDTRCRCQASACLALRELADSGLVQHAVHIGDENDQFRIVGWDDD
jgi:hypothetical protein